MSDLDTLHLRSHAESVCRDYGAHYEIYRYSLDVLCLMALTEALGLEYGEFVSASRAWFGGPNLQMGVALDAFTLA